MNKQMTLSEILNVYDKLSVFSQKDLDLPLEMAWNIETNLETLEPLVSRFVKIRNGKISDMITDGVIQCTSDKTPVQGSSGNYLPVLGKESEFENRLKELNDLLEMQNEVNVATVSFDNLPKTISISDIRALKFMVKPEGE